MFLLFSIFYFSRILDLDILICPSRYIGDTVGIRIHKVDRTNTDSNILPCKVLEVKKVTDSKSFYNIFSKDGILKTYYSDEFK
jgi:hypothetical protein